MTAAAYSTLQCGESPERGRAARRRTPRSAHGDWAPATDRPDPVTVLVAQATSRVQELVPIRLGADACLAAVAFSACAGR